VAVKVTEKAEYRLAVYRPVQKVHRIQPERLIFFRGHNAVIKKSGVAGFFIDLDLIKI